MSDHDFTAWLKEYATRVTDRVPSKMQWETILFQLDRVQSGKLETPGMNEVECCRGKD